MLFSTYSHTSHLLYCCFHCVLRSGDCLLCHGSVKVFAHNCFPFPQLFDHRHSGRSRGFRHSGGRAAAHHVLGSCAILEQRIRRHSHSTTAAASGGRHACGTAVPFQRCHKWRDAVKAAIMHGPLPPDDTLDVPHWWQPGMPLLEDRSREASIHARTRRGEAVVTPIRRVSMARRTLTAFAWQSSWFRSSSGPWRLTRSAGGVSAANLMLTAPTDRPWNCHHSPFRVLRTSGSVSASPLGSTSTAVCCASSTSNSSPPDTGRGSFCAACSYHGSSRRLTPATGRVRLTLPENANSCSCASSICAIASGSRRIANGTWTRQLCAWFEQVSVGGARGTNQPMSSLRAPSSRSHLL